MEYNATAFVGCDNGHVSGIFLLMFMKIESSENLKEVTECIIEDHPCRRYESN